MTDRASQDGFPPRAPGGLARLYAAVFVLFVAVYVLTAQRSVAWQDSGIFQLRILHGDFRGSLGLALAHPLLIALGRLFSWLPAGPLAWRMNLVSAVAGAAAVANAAVLVRRLAPSCRPAAWGTALFLGLGHTLWWLATICESQAIFLALFTLELNLLFSLLQRPREGRAILLGLVSGLALTAHNLALLALPAYGVTVLWLCGRRALRWRAAAGFVLAWLAGASGYLGLVAAETARTGLVPAVASALFGNHWQSYVLKGSLRAVSYGVGYVLYNFPNLALPLAVVGLASARKNLPRGGAWALGYLAAVYLLFAIRYAVPDQFMFFLPLYALVSVLAGLGLARLRGRGRPRLLPLALASALLAPLLYAAAPRFWQAAGLPLPGRKDLPYRDPARYWLSPWKSEEDSAARFARAALAGAPEGSVILADGTSRPSLRWTQEVDGAGRGVRVRDLSEEVPPERKGGPRVFLVSGDERHIPRWALKEASLHRLAGSDILFEVIWNRLSSAPIESR